MMGKSLSYAYAEGGAVKPNLPAVSFNEMNAMPDSPEKRAAAGALVTYREQQAAWAAENLTKPAEPAISYEQMKAMPMGDERVAAAKAYVAYGEAMKDYRKEANPDMDYSEAGRAEIQADAQAFLNSEEGQAAAARMKATEQLGTVSSAPVDLTSPFNQQPVDTTGGYNVGDNPAFLVSEQVVPDYSVDPRTQYDPMPEIQLENVLGDNAGQDAYQNYVGQLQPQVIPDQGPLYTPAEFMGIGSFVPEAVAQQEQGGYLRSSNPQGPFKRPYITDLGG